MKMRRGTATSVGRYGAKSFQHGMAPGPEARRVRLRCRLVAWGPMVRAVCMVRPWLVRVASTYNIWGPVCMPPCASGTYPTREAGTRSPYVPNGGRGAYGTCQLSAAPVLAALHATPRHAFDVEGRAILVERRRVRRQPAVMRAELEHVQPAERAERVLGGGNTADKASSMFELVL